MAPKVYAHVMSSQPPSLDNKQPLYLGGAAPGDYFDVYYTQPALEATTDYRRVGGFTRVAPAGWEDVVRPLPGDYNVTDWERSIVIAKAHGIDGFMIDLAAMYETGSKYWTRTLACYQAASNVGGFKITLVPDLTAGSVQAMSQTDFVAAMVTLASYSCIDLTDDGKLIVSPFIGDLVDYVTQSTAKSPTWWSQVLAQLTTATGLDTFFVPMPNSLSTTCMDRYDSIAQGYAPWGSRNPGAQAGMSTVVTTMRGRAGNATKSITFPVSFADSRHHKGVFDEGRNTLQYRTCWAQAIAACTLPNDRVQIPTWNDFPENSYIAPSRRDKGMGALKLTLYYGTKLKTGSYPTITKDAVHLMHRVHKAAPIFVLSAARNAGTAYTTLAVNAIATALSTGDKLLTVDGQQITVASPGAAIGATSIPIQSWTPTAQPAAASRGATTGAIASGAAVTKPTWSYVPPVGTYMPMTNRRYQGSPSSTDTIDELEVVTYLTAPADVTVTIGGVAQTPYTAPMGEYIQTYPLATHATIPPMAVISRSGTTVLTATSSTVVSPTPYVQDMNPVSTWVENPPPPVVDPGVPTPVRIMLALDTEANWTTENPTLKSGEWAWSTATAGAVPTKAKVGPGAYNSLPFVIDTARTTTETRYTTAGTFSYTIPTGAKTLLLEAYGGGGGSGSGRRGAAASVRCGGGAGGSGGYSFLTVNVADITGPLSVVVGAGGTAGAARTANDTDGAGGGAGGLSSISDATNLLVRAAGGGAGSGGTATTGTNGGSGGGLFNGTGGGAANTAGNGNAGTAGNNTTGGGAGGSITSGDVEGTGGAGGASSITGIAGGTGGAAGANGNAGASTLTGILRGGTGGGGGGASKTAAGGNGGAGGFPGGGAGGGGASLNGFNSGAGAVGGGGAVKITAYF